MSEQIRKPVGGRILAIVSAWLQNRWHINQSRRGVKCPEKP